MKLAVMQPYFFPYIGYFSLIKHTDKFILFDTVQFIYHGWIERNRILKPSEGWIYIKVPLQKHSRETKIKDILINNNQLWQDKIISQLGYYKKSAPYFHEVINILSSIFSTSYQHITELDNAAIKAVCSYLEIDTSIEVFSEMELDIEPAKKPDEWALNICKSINGVSEYWNPPGGINFFNKEKYKSNQIALKFQNVNLSEYDQKRESFEPGLSIIDVLMFNSVEQINKMLDDYEFI